MEIKVMKLPSLKIVARYSPRQNPEVIDDGLHFRVYANGELDRVYNSVYYHYEIIEKENES